MRAILIDPIARTFTEAEHNGDYKQIYEFLSDPLFGVEVDDFNSVRINYDNILWVDGEGLLKNPRYFMLLRGYSQPLAGRGLILGTNDEGESVGTTLTIAWCKQNIRFTELSVQGFEHSEGRGKHPLFGDEEINIIKQVPVFGPPENDDDPSKENS